MRTPPGPPTPLVLLIGTLILAGTVLAHGQGTRDGYTRVIYDCSHDWGWESSKMQDKGHELVTLDYREYYGPDGEPLVLFEINMVKADPTKSISGYEMRETLTFQSPRKEVSTTLRSTDENAFQFAGGEKPALVRHKWGLTNGSHADTRLPVAEVGYTYAQLQVQKGEQVSGFHVLAEYQESGRWRKGDFMPGGFYTYQPVTNKEERVDGCYGAPDKDPLKDDTYQYVDAQVILNSTWTVQSTVNKLPSAAFSFSPVEPVAGSPVVFTDASTDADGSVVAWSWDFGNGVTSTARNPSHAFAAPGTFTVELAVTDDAGAKAVATRTVTVRAPAQESGGNVPPVANFSFAPEAPRVGENVTFTDASTDADGTVSAWIWAFGDGNASAERDTVHTFARAGSFNVTLTATDDAGATASASRTITILPRENAAPVAVFTFTPADPRAGERVTFTDASADPDGGGLSWAWSFGDEATATERNPVYAFARAGTFNVTLTVTDAQGATDAMTRALTVRVAKDVPPEPDFYWAPLGPEVGQEVTFHDVTESGSSPVVARLWNFGSGSTSRDVAPVHVFKEARAYPVTLTVTDDAGVTVSKTIDVEILPPSGSDRDARGPSPGSGGSAEARAPRASSENPRLVDGVPAPVADFTTDASRPTDLDVVTFTDASVDPAGRAIVAWTWDMGDGTRAEGREVTHTFPDNGRYWVTLRVRNDGGSEAVVQKELIVANVPPNPDFTLTPAHPVPGQAVRFTDASTDPDGAIVDREWYIADQGPYREAETSFAFPRAGTFTVTLTVTDDDGITAMRSMEVHVEGEPVEALAEGGASVPGVPLIGILAALVIALATRRRS